MSAPVDWEPSVLGEATDADAVWWVVWTAPPTRTRGKPRRRRRSKRLL